MLHEFLSGELYEFKVKKVYDCSKKSVLYQYLNAVFTDNVKFKKNLLFVFQKFF